LKPGFKGETADFKTSTTETSKDLMKLLGLHKISRLKSVLFPRCAADQKLEDAGFGFR
jgi:hypothetical protein